MEEKKITDINGLELIVPTTIKLSTLRKMIIEDYSDVVLENKGGIIVISFNDDGCEVDIENHLITYVEIDEGITNDYFNLLKIGEVFVEIDIYVA